MNAVLDRAERYGAGQSAGVPVSQTLPALRVGTWIHQCAECQTVYSEQYGDPLGGVDAGTPFVDLPASWTCPTYGAPQSKYIAMRKRAA